MMKYKNIALIFILLAFFGVVYYLLSVKRTNTNEPVSYSVTPLPTKVPFLTNTPPPTPTPNLFAGLRIENFYVTFYGWPDNDPPGNTIAYPKRRYSGSFHDNAGGIGTYKNPITFASDPEHIALGSIYYVISLQKYTVMEDLCTGCIDSWDSSTKHIDIWMDSNSGFEEELLRCQRRQTRKSVEVVLNPPANLPVDTTPLFNKNTGECP